MADYTDLRGRFVYKRPVYWAELDTLAENDAHAEENGWEDGCKAVFYQAAAPTGWTKDATSSLDGKTLRITSATGGGTGGTHPIASALTLAHTHPVPTDSTHVHAMSHIHVKHSYAYNEGCLVAAFGHAATKDGKVVVVDSGGDLSAKKLNNDGYMIWTSIPDPAASTEAGGAHDHGGTSGSALADSTVLAYADVIVCARDASAGYTDMTSAFSYGLDVDAAPLVSLAGNDEHARARLIPAGTVMMFGSAAAPSGWNKLATQNDKALRIVTGTGGGAGGSHSIASDLALAHSAHAVTSGGAHGHHIGLHTHGWRHNLDASGDANATYGGTGVPRKISWYANVPGLAMLIVADGSASGGDVITDHTSEGGNVDTSSMSDGAHTHAASSGGADGNLAYMDVIQCQKSAYDLAGYTDMSAFFVADDLLAWQDMEAMAQNDDWIQNNQIPQDSVSFFFQAAAPLNWTKLTSVDDKCLRIVSAAGGGTGGDFAMSTGITLAHGHALDNPSHTHGTSAHPHGYASVYDANRGNYVNGNTQGGDMSAYTAPDVNSGQVKVLNSIAYSITKRWDGENTAVTGQGTLTGGSGTHGAGLSSGGTDLVLAYADVLMCEKD
jgi:hypothetical protein